MPTQHESKELGSENNILFTENGLPSEEGDVRETRIILCDPREEKPV